MTTLIVLLGLGIYVGLYLTYGRKVARDVVKASDDQPTPANRLFDGVDYIPARREVLIGHHFASIAGAAPIVGPAVAMVWGWLLGLLWVWFGNVFIGAIHDYLSLMASVRYDGKSVQFVASDLLGRRTGDAFYVIVFFLLVLVVAAFAAIVGGMFVRNGEIATAYLLKIVAALILGVLLYRTKMNFGLASLIGIVMLVGAIWLGSLFPIVASYNTWMAVFFFYIIFASALPVNVLLQPRDYLNSFLLYAGLVLGGVGAVVAFHGFEVPMASGFAPVLFSGKATPFWPAITLVIACGALSGFHALVASGTTSKQLKKESDGLAVGMGSMFMEGFLSTIVIVSIAGFGYTALRHAAAVAKLPMTLTVDNWGQAFGSTTAALHLGGANLFVQSYSDMVNSTWVGYLVPSVFLTILAGMWVASFAMTTLDTANRLGRYALTEIVAPLQTSAPAVYNLLANRWVASLIPAGLGIYLAWSGSWLVIWGSFAAANQLIASVALLTAAAYVAKRLKSRFSAAALIPALLLWVTVTVGTIWYLAVVMPADIAKHPGPGWTQAVMLAIMLILNFVFIYDFARSYWGKEHAPPHAAVAKA
jgi:carbon starvation protein